ncbi:hypothetical protein [Larkinella soli]|uniref:hypothetical protein n=1 Tax=Larkinella soli TaxID=1770527 RepID=UPI000FFBE7D6|nr:hypothetical protein [Larkinella soli]
MKRFPVRALALVLLAAGGLHAQSLAVDTLAPQMPRPPKWVVKPAPLALFDPHNTIQAGAERLLGGRHSVQGEFGYGWQGINLYPDLRDDYDRFEVWRGRAEWRRYSGRYRSHRKPHFATVPLGRYIAVEVFYKQISTLQNTAVGRECVDGTCAFFERGTFPISRTVWGSHFKIGRQFVMTMPGDNRWVLDFYMGLGFRSVNSPRISGTPEEVVRDISLPLNLWDTGERGLRLSGTLGLKVGYIL